MPFATPPPTSQRPRPSRLLAAAVALLGLQLLLRLVSVFLYNGPVLAALPPDDAYYYFQVARHVASGQGSSFDGLEPTNGYHPLWMIVCSTVALALGVGPDGPGQSFLFIRVMLAIQALLFGAGAALLLVSLRGWGAGAMALAAAAAGTPFLFYFASDGLESGLVILGLGGWLAFAAHTRVYTAPPSLRDVAHGALLSLMALARLDLALMATVAGLALLLPVAGTPPWRERLAKFAAAALPGLLMASVYTIVNGTHFDTVVPISVQLKSTFPAPVMDVGRLAGELPGITAGLAAVAGAGWLFLRSAGEETPMRLPWLVVAVYTLLHLANTLLFVGWGIHHWHFASEYVLGAAAAAAILGPMVDRLPTWGRRGAGALVLAAMAGGLALSISLPLARPDYAFQRQSMEAAAWAREHLPENALVGMTDCGAFGYFRGGGVVNLDGVINNRAYQEALRINGLGSYLNRRAIDWLAYHAVPEDEVAPGYGTREYAVRERLFAGTRHAVIVHEGDEVYRGPVYNDGNGRRVFVIWHYRRPALEGLPLR